MTNKNNRRPTLSVARRRRSAFLEHYGLDRSYMLKPDPSNGRPGIYCGFSPDGDAVLAKVWPRTGQAGDSDLEDIWRHELRQLHRLAGYPGAAECIAHLHDAGYDEDGFYLILAPGQRRPLYALLNTVAQDHWIKQPRQAVNRARIWRNLGILAQGLESLHSQGLLHRNIDMWAVLTTGSEEPDFQLTGFEWSMRIVGAERARQKSDRQKNGSRHDSFLNDWLMFGLLAANLLKIEVRRLCDISIPPHEVAEHVSVEEVRLVRTIIQTYPLTLLDGEIVRNRIDDVLRLLASEIAGREPKLHLVFRLGSSSSLAEQIRIASGNEIETDDIEGQLTFLSDDLREEPMLLALKPWDGGEGMRLVLRGKNLSYQLREYRLPRQGATPTWEFAYCEATEKGPPAPINIVGSRIIEASALEILTTSEAATRFPRVRGKVTSWDGLRNALRGEEMSRSREDLSHRALSLIQFLEALYAAADVFPVEVLPEKSGEQFGGEVILRVRPRRDPERDNLSKALRLKSPNIRLHEALVNENVRSEGWILSDSRSTGERNPTDSDWRFQKIERVPGQQDVFEFIGTNSVSPGSDAFLVPEGVHGRDKQFRRRLKALRALKDHQELLRMISDPRQRIMESHDRLATNDDFSGLDEPKKQALQELVSTLPLYLIQGPPGVGKTRLIRELVKRLFQDEPTSRVLLTAQSNAAVDHLLGELEAIVSSEMIEAPLIVRCRAKEGRDVHNVFDIGVQARKVVSQFAASKLISQLPPRFGAALSAISATVQANGASDQAQYNDGVALSGRAAAQALHAIEGIAARAANIVFATTNSSELERLIEERGQFDWAMIEEAGKATGSELVPPMLLSHRRLMIGDHKQLPPFGSEQMIALLEVPESVLEAVKVGEEFVGRSLRDTTTEEILDEIEDDGSELPALCAEALRVFTYFETTIEAEFGRQMRKRGGKPIAKRLTEQHRMHPAIARLVSRCFYNGELESHPECVSRYATTSCPFDSANNRRLPSTPIVVVDVPYVQAAIGEQTDDKYPRWHNPIEVKAVLEVVGLLRANVLCEEPPTLAILSPYSEQVRRLDAAISDGKSTSKLSSLDGFKPPTHAGAFCHTVDSFQGSEADVVVVSLVRNNAHSNVQNALGFLSDQRRMNVLLSRGKWQLILVTSVAFLSEIVASARGGNDELRIKFIEEMLAELRKGERSKVASIVPLRQLMGTH